MEIHVTTIYCNNYDVISDSPKITWIYNADISGITMLYRHTNILIQDEWITKHGRSRLA
jgi:hypothetical protein